MRVARGIDRLPSGKLRVRVKHRGATVTQIVEDAAEAERVRDAIKRAIVDGDLVPAAGLTMADLGARYLATRKRERDHGNVTSRWETHVAPAPWAQKPLGAVTRRDGEAWLAALEGRTTAHAYPGDRPAKPLSHQTRRHVLGLARAGLAWAVRAEHIEANPFRELRIAREDGDEEEGFQPGWYLTPDERAAFLSGWDKLDEPHDRLERHIVAFALGTGLRLGELVLPAPRRSPHRRRRGASRGRAVRELRPRRRALPVTQGPPRRAERAPRAVVGARARRGTGMA